MSLYLSSPETRMPRSPDFSFGSPEADLEIAYWYPDVAGTVAHGFVGKQLHGERIRGTAVHLESEMRLASEQLSTSNALIPFFNYCGFNATLVPGANLYDPHYYHFTFPDTSLLNRRLDELELPNDHQPPRFSAYPGGEFPAEEGAAELAQAKRFLIGHSEIEAQGGQAQLREPTLFHDMITHGTAYLLLMPKHLDRLQYLAQQAQAPYEAGQLMGRIDDIVNSFSLGGTIFTAFIQEAKNESLETEARKNLVHSQWRGVGADLAKLLDIPATPSEQEALGYEMREHCLILAAAAAKQTA